MDEACRTHGFKGSVYYILLEISERKGPLGRRRDKWEDNIKVGYKEMGYEVVDSINLAQSRGH